MCQMRPLCLSQVQNLLRANVLTLSWLHLRCGMRGRRQYVGRLCSHTSPHPSLRRDLSGAQRLASCVGGRRRFRRRRHLPVWFGDLIVCMVMYLSMTL